MAEQLESGDYTTGVVSNPAIRVRGDRTLLRTAGKQGVISEPLSPYARLMECRLTQGRGNEDGAGVVGLLTAARS